MGGNGTGRKGGQRSVRSKGRSHEVGLRIPGSSGEMDQGTGWHGLGQGGYWMWWRWGGSEGERPSKLPL